MTEPEIVIYDMKTEHLASPNAVDNPHPRLGWKIRQTGGNLCGLVQKSYRIRVFSGEKCIWDSGIVESDAQLVRYEGEPLESLETVSWKAEAIVFDENGRSYTAESGFGSFTMGLLKEDDWQADWIQAPEKSADPSERKPAAYLRKAFTVKGRVKRALIAQTAHGLYEFYINGIPGTADKFKPGLTSYYYRLQYQLYDITSLLREGGNVWAVTLADGWWRGVTGGTCRNNFGFRTGFLGQIRIEYEDGSVQTIVTDRDFRTCTEGGLRASDMMMGDIFDARKEPEGWKLPGFDDADWQQAEPHTEYVNPKLIASRSVPVREKETFDGRPFTDVEGSLVLDFAQNIAGYVQVKFHDTKPGQKIRMVFGEELKAGKFDITEISQTTVKIPVFQEITYICRGGEEVYHPDFCVFGFQYMKLEGYENEIRPGDMTAIAVYSDLDYNGDFTCSEPLIDQLVKNARWSQKGNFLDVPTDCPTRERNAWTGDAQLYAPTAALFADAYPFFEKWMIDQKIEQYDSGKVNFTFPATSSVHNPDALGELRKISPIHQLAGPSGNGNIGEDSTGWGDSAVWIPYVIYKAAGDRQILENQYETMKRYVDYEIACAHETNPLYKEEPYYKNETFGEPDANYIFDTRFQYGEWNEWKPEEAQPEEKKADGKDKPTPAELAALFVQYMAKYGNRVVATAYTMRSCENLADVAEILGKEDDAAHYWETARRTRFLYDKYLIAEDGTIEKGHQAPYVRALTMNLVSDGKRKAVEKQLMDEIKANGYRLNTGFLSTPFLLPTLVDMGRKDTAFRILESKEIPGWLNPVLHGATTIPECWDGFEKHRASLNHYSYGSVCEFLFTYVGGIRPRLSEPGYREFDIRPVIGGSLTEAKAKVESPYGTIISSWRKETDGTIAYHFEIPAGTKAHVILESGQSAVLGSGTYDMLMIKGVRW